MPFLASDAQPLAHLRKPFLGSNEQNAHSSVRSCFSASSVSIGLLHYYLFLYWFTWKTLLLLRKLSSDPRKLPPLPRKYAEDSTTSMEASTEAIFLDASMDVVDAPAGSPGTYHERNPPRSVGLLPSKLQSPLPRASTETFMVYFHGNSYELPMK